MNILFVCLGNICRSPAAEGVMQRLVADAGLDSAISIDSAGTYGGHAGELPDLRMRNAALARGYKLTSRSRQIKRADFEQFDLVIVMDDSNYHQVCRLAPDVESVAKVHRMTDFCSTINADRVPDPYYEGAEGFEIVLDILEDSCAGLLEQIRKGDLRTK